MPSVTALRTGDKLQSKDVTSENKPKKVILRLPSKLPASTPCDSRLRRIEWELRHEQANNALNDVRRAIQVYVHITMFKRLNVRGQWSNTRACGALNHAEKKKQHANLGTQLHMSICRRSPPGSTRLAGMMFFILCRMLT
jgi:hypothetical protein